jgi:hypothetical protein
VRGRQPGSRHARVQAQASAARPDSGALPRPTGSATHAAGPHVVHRHDLRRQAAPNRRRTRRLAFAIACLRPCCPRNCPQDEVERGPEVGNRSMAAVPLRADGRTRTGDPFITSVRRARDVRAVAGMDRHKVPAHPCSCGEAARDAPVPYGRARVPVPYLAADANGASRSTRALGSAAQGVTRHCRPGPAAETTASTR